MLQRVKELILERVGDYCYGENNTTIEQTIYQLLERHQQTIAVAESLTGGLFQSRLVSVPCSSTVFQGGIVSYSRSSKEQILRVTKETIETYGMVSEQCAKEMAQRVASLMNASLGLSFTGVAGPNPTEGKAVGTVFISLYSSDGFVQVERCQFSGNRQQIRYRAVLKGFEMIFKYLKNKF